MIGGLQGEFGDLDNKYLKQNIPKCLKMSVENIRKVQENTAALYTERKTLQVSIIRRSGYVYLEKLKRLPLPSGYRISGCKMSAHGMSSFPIRTPSGKSTRHSWTSHPDDSISYPDMLSGWKTLTKASKPCNFIPKACHNPCSAAL